MLAFSTSQITANAPDILLILISGLACLYCAILSRRLKNLSDLKSGLGASIVTLTQAIENTHKAAQEAQTSTMDAVKTLRELLETSENATPQIEVLVAELEQARKNAKVQREQLEDTIEISLSHAITRAHNTATGLLSIISDINESKEQLEKQKSDVKAELKTVERASYKTVQGPQFDFGDDTENTESRDDTDDEPILQFAS